MSSDSSKLMDRLDEAHLRSTKEAVSNFLILSERLKGRWKGSLGSVEEASSRLLIEAFSSFNLGFKHFHFQD
jgi:hypothetical protein